MASSSSPPAISPSSSSSSSPPSSSSSLSPLPSASQSPNATSEPPASMNPPPPPPLPSASPPTSIPNSPPPTSTLTPPPSQADPPSVSPPPPSEPSLPPPTSPTSSPPPPSVPTLPPPTPPTSSPPPPSVPALPPQAPPTSSMPPPSTPTLPPPTPPTSPPSPPPLPLPIPPTPPEATPLVPLPPAPVSASPPPTRSQTPPQDPSTSPLNNQPPSVPSPPNNSSSGPPILTNPPPLPPSNTPPGNPSTPINPNGNKSSTLDPNVTAGTGSSSGSKNGVVVPVAIVTTILVLSLVGLAVWYFRKKKRRTTGYGAGFVMPSPLTSSQVSESSYPWSPAAPLVYNSSGSHGVINSPPDTGGLGNSKSLFSYEDLYTVTNGFSENNLLGEGGFGCVYKGCLPDGREVAVKQLKVGGSQGEREFRAEVEIIGRVHHRHLVSLVGYCIADNQRLLVYDYVPNNTLHYHLHAEGRPVLDWAIRVKVAAGAARGIAYLHEDCHPRIIHRDIKSSNILLDNSYEAQVSDFGLAKLAQDAVTHVTTRVMGTFGYMAPEYASSGKLTERSDVYSFGVVLLELITGRKPVDTSQPLGDESLVEWARPLLTQALETGDFDSLTDPRLEKNYNAGEMFRMTETAAACIRHSAPIRPRMGLVVRALDGLADVDLNNGLKPGQSELFSAQSAEIRMFQRMAFGSQDYSSDFSNFSNFSKTSRNSQRDL